MSAASTRPRLTPCRRRCCPTERRDEVRRRHQHAGRDRRHLARAYRQHRPVDLRPPGRVPAATARSSSASRRRTHRHFGVTAKKFYATHPDNYDQILCGRISHSSATRLPTRLNIANKVRGIGQDIFDISVDRQRRPAARAGGDGLAGQVSGGSDAEVPRREQHAQRARPGGRPPLAGLRGVPRPDRARSKALLGRDDAHWSFFFDSDASVMEGNDIEDLGGGAVQDRRRGQRFSALDQYTMGLHPAESRCRRSSTSRARNSPRGPGDAPQSASRSPARGATCWSRTSSRSTARACPSAARLQAFTGRPSSTSSAWARPPALPDLEKVDRIRLAWESFFLRATDGRMRAETRLQPPS